MRKVALILSFVVLLSGLALAQIPTSGNIFFGYSYVNTDVSPVSRTSTNGWEFTAEGKVFPFVGIAADFSSYYGSQNFAGVVACPGGPCPALVNVGVNQQNYLFGLARVDLCFKIPPLCGIPDRGGTCQRACGRIGYIVRHCNRRWPGLQNSAHPGVAIPG